MPKATHVRLKTKTKVYVERHEGGILVVKNMRGKFIGSYEGKTVAKFYERYKSLAARKQGG